MNLDALTIGLIILFQAFTLSSVAQAKINEISTYGGSYGNTAISGTNMYVKKGSRTIEHYDITDIGNPILKGKKILKDVGVLTNFIASGANLLMNSADDRGYGIILLLDFTNSSNEYKWLGYNNNNFYLDGDYLYTTGPSGITRYYFDSKKKTLTFSLEYPVREEFTFLSVLKNNIIVGNNYYILVLNKPQFSKGGEKFEKIAEIQTPSSTSRRLNGTPFEHNGLLFLDFGYDGLWRYDLSQNTLSLATKQFQYCRSIVGIKTALVASCLGEIQLFNKDTYEILSKTNLKADSIKSLQPDSDIFFINNHNNVGITGLSIIKWSGNSANLIKTFHGIGISKVKIYDGTLFLAVSGGQQNDGLYILDPNNGNPNELGKIDLHNVTDFEKVGEFLFITTADDGSDLFLYDISSLNSPVLKKTTKVHKYSDIRPRSLKVTEEKIFVNLGYKTGVGEMAIYKQDLTFLARFQTIDTYSSFAIKDDFLYLISSSGLGVNIYDTSEPNNIRVVKNFECNTCNGVQLEKDRLYFSEYWFGFRIYSLETPINPVLIPDTTKSRPVNTVALRISNDFGVSLTGISDAVATFWNFSNPDHPTPFDKMHFYSSAVPRSLATYNGIYYFVHGEELLIAK